MVRVNRRYARPKKLFIFCAMLLCVFTYIANYLIRLSCDDVHRNFRKELLRESNDVSCYYKENLTSELETPFENNSIFLISTSCETSLNLLESCAIESVVRSHDRQVYVLLTRPVKECPCQQGLLAGLKSFPKIKFVVIKVDRFVENTPLANIFNKRFIDTGVQRHRRIAEVLKFATLYKYGGVVFDTNIIMAKSVDFLGKNWGVSVKNWGVSMNMSQIGSAAISLNMKTSFGRSILELAITKIKEQKHQAHVHAGAALTQAFQQLCSSDSFHSGCANFRIYETQLFYPLNRTMTRMVELYPTAYGYYIWNKKQFVQKIQLYKNLTQEYCPNVNLFS